MTTNYKTSFLLPHDYEIPTFNYPQYVLPPVPYNYKPYTKDIWDANAIQPLKTKVIAPAQCKKTNSAGEVNLFPDEFNEGYYETEIDLKQIDPTIQSISKFQDAYKTIEISNLGNLQVDCSQPNIENFIPDRNLNILSGADCNTNLGSLNNLTLIRNGLSQADKVNFKFDIENLIVLDTKEIPINEIKKLRTGYTNGIPFDPTKDYENGYTLLNSRGVLDFIIKITTFDYNDNPKYKETYLQAYYTNDVKLKIRISKNMKTNFNMNSTQHWNYFGNDKEILVNVNNINTLSIKNNSNSPISITLIPKN